MGKPETKLEKAFKKCGKAVGDMERAAKEGYTALHELLQAVRDYQRQIEEKKKREK